MPPERNTKKDLDNIQKAIDRKTAKDFRVVDGGTRWVSSPKNIENVLAEIDDKIIAGSAIKVYSAPSGDPDEVQVLNVSKLRFIQEYTPGGHHVVFDAGAGECWVGVEPPPSTLQGQNLLTYPTKYTGGLSFSPTSTYKGADPAGSIVNYIIRGNSWNVSTPAGCFGYASVGLLIFSLNGVDVATIDLGSNFVEGNRATGQIIAGYNTQGAGSLIAAGVVTFVGGQLQINSVAPSTPSGIPTTDIYQQGNATIIINGCLIEGYNTLQLRHVVGMITYSAVLWECYEDIDPAGANDPAVTVLDMSLNSLIAKYLSGVQYCDVGSQFDQDMTALRVADNVYHSTLSCILLSSFPGLASNYPTFAECGVAPFPNVGDIFQFVNRLVTLSVANAFSEISSLIGTPRDPYGSYVAYVSSKNILVNTYGTPSTSLWEPCVDENWRLPSGAYDTPPVAWTGNWDSTGDLNTYDTADGLQYRGGVYYPEYDYTTWIPSIGQPDYTPIWGANAPLWLWRGFRDNGISHSNGIIRLPGITESTLAASQILIWIKVPTKTGWLRLHGTLYNSAGWTGIDNDPCRITGGSGNDHNFTLATLGTNAASDYGVVVRIEIPNRTSPEITGAWGMVGW